MHVHVPFQDLHALYGAARMPRHSNEWFPLLSPPLATTWAPGWTACKELNGAAPEPHLLQIVHMVESRFKRIDCDSTTVVLAGCCTDPHHRRSSVIRWHSQ
jgi:hypothetical protein